VHGPQFGGEIHSPIVAQRVIRTVVRCCAVGLVLLLVAQVWPAAAQDPPRITERVEVARILLDVRAIDPRGRPLLGLGPSDFEVKIDGKVARVESVQHVSGERVGGPPRTIAESAMDGRLVVFLFQKSLDRSRIPGLMQMLRDLRRNLATFPSTDHVAVLRFDSRLELLLDFTRNKDQIGQSFERDVLFGAAAAVAEADGPSLRSLVEHERTDPSFTMEKSLLSVAEALESFPGPKSLVLVGHGFGQSSRAGVTLDREYDAAVNALHRARASVFCLDVTNADYHTLETGLQIVADDTGGLYQRTHVFSEAALNRVMAALEGQYVLFVEKPGLATGAHRLDVRLKGRDGVVLAPSSYVSQVTR
jgi:VWFA-related protein